MSKQGHKFTGWKNRYFVLTADTLSYYKEEVAEGSSATRASALAGSLSLIGARVFPIMWAPENMFGWMIMTSAGVKYPFRCFGFKDRESWLNQVNTLDCITVSEEDRKQATTTTWGFSKRTSDSFKRFSFSGGTSSNNKKPDPLPFKSGGGETSAELEQQVTLFLNEAGLRHVAQRFLDSGVRSLPQLCVEVASPTMTDAVLMAPPLSLRMGEIEKLRTAVDKASQGSDMQMRQYLSENNFNQYLEKLEAYGVTQLRDLVDPNILNDDDLAAEIGMNPEQVLAFRKAATAWTAEHGSVQQGGGGGGNSAGGGDVEEDDDDDDDEENEERMTMDEFFMLRNDVINSAHATLGMPYVGRHGKCHPIFDIVLIGMKKSKRVRSYRFRTLREFQEDQVMNETGFSIQRLSTSFPSTLTKSRFGIQLSEAELEERVRQLSIWVEELLRVRGAMSPRLRRATLALLQLDEVQLFPESLSLGRTEPSNSQPPAVAQNTAPAAMGGGGGAVAQQQMTPTSEPSSNKNEVLTEISISKGPTGLGLDLVRVDTGKVIVSIFRPYDCAGGVKQRHPADLASPPLMDGDEVVAINGLTFGDDLELCKSTIASAPANLTMTVKRIVVGAAGALLGDWNVAMGNSSLFITAHETTIQESNRKGLLFLILEVTQGWRCALLVPPAEVSAITSAHFGASLLSPTKGLQLAKLFANFLVQNEQSFILRTPDNQVVGWSCVCDPMDTVQVCYQLAYDEHRRSSTAQKALQSSSTPSATPTAGASDDDDDSIRYGLNVEGIGPVSGVPRIALRDVNTKLPFTSRLVLGQQVEIDVKTHWTSGTITEVQEGSGGDNSALLQQSPTSKQELVEDSDDEVQDDDDKSVATTTNTSTSGAAAADGDDEEEELDDKEAVNINDQFGGLMSFEEFKDSLTRGIEVVKFNRRGNAAFRTITLIGDHTLTWMTPKDALEGVDAKKSKGNFDLREVISVRPGEAIDPQAKNPGEIGTPTLRQYVAKHEDGKEMQATGHCLSLIFPDRSVDIGTDSVAHRDFLLNGFRLLAQRGPSGGKLITFELTKSKNPILINGKKKKNELLGFSLKSEVKSTGVVEMVLVVGQVFQGSMADQLGMKPGDRVYEINGQQQHKWLSKKPPTPAKFASLVQYKLDKLANNKKKPVEVVIERLDLDKHLVASEAATSLKVVKERKLAEWLRAHDLEKFTIKFIQLGVESVDELKSGKVLLRSHQINMTKADWKKYNRALETYVIVDDATYEANDKEAKASRRGSLELGTETSRAGVSFGLKGPTGGRLVSVTLTEKALGLTVGHVNDVNGQPSQGVYVLAMKDESEAARKGIQLEDRLHQINGSTLPLTMGHKAIRSKVKNSRRPLHLILERIKQEDKDFVSATDVAMNGYVIAAAEEMEVESLLDLKAVILQNGNEKAASWLSSWTEGSDIATWYHIKTEKGSDGRVMTTEVDLSNLDIDITLHDLRQALLGLNRLRDLLLSGNPRLKGDIRLLDEEALPSIKTLYLHNCPLLEGDITSIFCLKTLVTLNVDNNNLIYGDKKETKQRLPNLKVLSMRGLSPAHPSF
jgi:hypothetical protein